MTIEIVSWLLHKTPYVAAFAVGLFFLRKYMNGGVCKSRARLDGKIVVITGANAGIGKETAKQIVSRGAKVYLACRSLERAARAVKDIEKEIGTRADKLFILPLDLGSLKSIREFVKEFKTRENKLDILINNAGVLSSRPTRTVDGFETTFGVNHLGHFLLTNLLMDVLSSVPKSRIINVSSIAHRSGRIDFDDLMMEKNYRAMDAYSHSKLANILFTRQLAERLKGTGITSYSLHPGAIKTDMAREVPFLKNAIVRTLFFTLAWAFGKGLWYGAQTTIFCAVDEGLDDQSGKYYSDCKEKEPTKRAQDDEVGRKLWDVSVNLVKLDQSEIHPKLRSAP